MEISRVSIDALIPDPSNARMHDEVNISAIKGSLAKFGQQKPIVITKNNVVVAGNGTLEAAKALGWTELDVVYSELSGTEAIAYALSDNRTSELGSWNKGILGKQLLGLSREGFGIANIGFDPKEWLRIKDNPLDEKKSEDDLLSDDAPLDESDNNENDKIPYSVEAKVSYGDTWNLGRHMLHCGSSEDEAAVHSHIGEGEAHAIVTDPPYGLEFMGKAWDKGVPSKELWDVWFSRIKSGAHLLSFSGTRTYHLMTTAIENAGFEVRDMMQWIYGQGFPKSQDISKAIDKAAGAEREVIGSKVADDIRGGNMHASNRGERHTIDITAPATHEAKQWSGWGSALKPANEPICLARKPMSESTIANNVLKHGTGGLNIDASRIGTEGSRTNASAPKAERNGFVKGFVGGTETVIHDQGRFPSNVILDEEAGKVLDEQTKGVLHSAGKGRTKNIISEYNASSYHAPIIRQSNRFEDFDNVGASRFFYIAKASKSDRGDGNNHATVKPIKLMEYLINLVTPKGGTILEPFAGSGTTLLAAEKVGVCCKAFEIDPHHCDIILARFKSLTGIEPQLVSRVNGKT